MATIAASSSARLFTSRNAAVSRPQSRNSCFSLNRSCAKANAAGGGYTGTRCASHAAVSAGTFSKSKLTASTLAANSANAARSLQSATICGVT
ncbi:hypothetical protein RF55_22069 [Lasius niger]|uniref:Uncharacterized protein n=1 Tax=Lasius niger TaxID=67767 RepID=A0A0J7JXX6_LASNI|nr:hypothetical protein RF55_22069 [Lasius niger]